MDNHRTAQEALRILRKVRTSFSTGDNKSGSAFVWNKPGIVITCAHVVEHNGATLSKLEVEGKSATIQSIDRSIDVAYLKTSDTDTCTSGDATELHCGDELVFSGYPSGVRAASVFSGIVSAIGDNLIDYPKCKIIQVNGMINLGNSGGPVLRAGTNEVMGIVTAKNVPLLREIDSLREFLRTLPQFPSEVGIGIIDFSKYVNLVTGALIKISSSLRMVQVGVGYAVPVNLIAR